jgi:hypothetical protein
VDAGIAIVGVVMVEPIAHDVLVQAGTGQFVWVGTTQKLEQTARVVIFRIDVQVAGLSGVVGVGVVCASTLRQYAMSETLSVKRSRRLSISIPCGHAANKPTRVEWRFIFLEIGMAHQVQRGQITGHSSVHSDVLILRKWKEKLPRPP